MEVEGYAFNEFLKLEENIAEESSFDEGEISSHGYIRVLRVELDKGVIFFEWSVTKQ